MVLNVFDERKILDIHINHRPSSHKRVTNVQNFNKAQFGHKVEARMLTSEHKFDHCIDPGSMLCPQDTDY